MSIDIQKLAELSKVSLTQGNLATHTDLNEEINDMVEMMTLPKIDEIPYVLDSSNIMKLRTDIVKPSMKREDLLAGAPQTQAGCIVVPRTI